MTAQLVEDGDKSKKALKHKIEELGKNSAIYKGNAENLVSLSLLWWRVGVQRVRDR